MTVSHKADRKKLPPPKGPRFSVGSGKFVAPRGETEEALARALGEVLKIERVSVEDNFFKDLGAHSLLMARFCAEIRQRLDVCGRLDARHLPQSDHRASSPRIWRRGRQEDAAQPPRRSRPHPVAISNTTAAALCSCSIYVGCTAFGLWLLVVALDWIYAAHRQSRGALSARPCRRGSACFVAADRVPDRRQVAADRPLEGRDIPDLEPALLPLLGGQDADPERADGRCSPAPRSTTSICGCSARRSAATPSSRPSIVPVCTDLLSIGDNTIIRKDCVLLGYKAQSNYIHTGPITIGDNAFVGEATVLDIDTAMGDDTQLGHASSLQSGQRVPARQALSRLARAGDARPTTASVEAGAARRCGVSLYSAIPADRHRWCSSPIGSLVGRLCYWYTSSALTSVGELDLDAPCRRCTAGHRRMLLVSLALFVGALLLGLRVGLSGPAAASTAPAGRTRPTSLYGVPLLHLACRSRALSNSASSTTSCSATAPSSSTTCKLDRLEPEQGRADRLELRHRPEARQPVPVRHRQRHDGLGRAVDDQRADCRARRSSSAR